MKILDQEQLQSAVSDMRTENKTIVFTNGCFDILHAGHVRYLKAAKQLGDILIVGLNSDKAVRLLKGSSRPINSEEDRAEVLAGLESVDNIIIFGDQTAAGIIELVRPDIYVKGGDYVIEKIPEVSVVEQYGGKTVLIPEVKGRSSTNIIDRIQRYK